MSTTGRRSAPTLIRFNPPASERLIMNLDQMYNEADRLKDEGKYPEAVEKLNAILSQDETYALAHFALAVAYGKLENHEAAIRHGLRGCELEPNDAFSYTALSVTYKRAFDGTQNPQFIQLAEDAMARAHMLQGSR